MSANGSSVGANGAPSAVPRLIRDVYWGAIMGLFGGLATLFAISTYYGSTVTDSPSECAIFGGAFTVLLSQPAAFFGLIAGAAAGAVVGCVGICVRHFRLAS